MAALVRAGFSFSKNAVFTSSVRSISTTKQLNLKESKLHQQEFNNPFLLFC